MGADYELRERLIREIGSDSFARKWVLNALQQIARGCEHHETSLLGKKKQEESPAMAAAFHLVSDVYDELGDAVVHQLVELEFNWK